MRTIRSYLGRIKRKFRQRLLRRAEENFYKTEALDALNMEQLKNAELCVMTVAFNNAEVIAQQMSRLKKYLQRPYAYLVADNSSDREESSAVRRIIDVGGGYVRLPPNPFRLSQSHAAALNWTCRNVLANNNITSALILDQDVMPFKPCDIIQQAKGQFFYGRLQDWFGGKWYVWPGFFYIKGADFRNMDFFTTEWGDTGARMYEKLFSVISKHKYSFAEEKRVDIFHDGTTRVAQEGSVEIFDSCWIHFINSSNWRNVDMDTKFERIAEYLRTIETQP